MKATFQANLLGVLLIFIILYFFLIYIPEKDFNYSIELKEGKVKQGTTAILSYNLINNLDTSIEKVEFHYWISNYAENIKEIGNISSKQKISGSVELKTDFIPSGTYTIFTKVTYLQNKQSKEKELTLQIQIF